MDNPKNRGLGRGLDALFGPAEENIGPITLLNVAQMRPCGFQPRTHFDTEGLTALAESITAHGILQPLLVRPMGAGVYEIVAGERRWRAAQMAGLHDVPVVVREMDDKATLEVALIENLQRADLDAVEEATGYQRLLRDFGHTQNTLAKVMGKSRPHIANALRLLALPEEVLVLLREGKISPSHARALTTARAPTEMAQHVVKGALSVRETERIVARSMRGGDLFAAKAVDRAEKESIDAFNAQAMSQMAAVEEALSAGFGMKAQVLLKGRGGKITLTFTKIEQIEAVLHTLSAKAG